MRAISIYQAWASAMLASVTVSGSAVRLKAIETRGWATRYRGPLLICASVRWDGWLRHQAEHLQGETLAGWRDPFGSLVAVGGVRLAALQVRDLVGSKRLWVLPLGAVLGVVDLVDCVPTEQMHGRIPAWEWAMGDYSPGRFAWITERPRPLIKPIAIRGRQGLFTPSPEICSQVDA